MSAFSYSALDLKGKRKKGVLEADTARQVRQKIRDQGLIPIDVSEVVESDRIRFSLRKLSASWRYLFTRRMKVAELSLLTRQLATLLTAGIPLDDALLTVANQNEKRSIKSIILGVRSKVLEGHPLASGMEDFPSAFPRLYRITVASGEKSGQLASVLLKLAEYTEKQHEIRRKINQALIYPLLMTVVATSIVIFLLLYVVPKIMSVFLQTNQTLPLATTILLALSRVLHQDGLYLLGFSLLLLLFFRWVLKKPNFRKRWHQVLLKLPMLGKSIQTVNTARFARTFGILSSAGVPVIEAMSSSAQLIMPLNMREGVERAILQVREGTAIHRALQQTHFFSPMFIHLVASGEKSGQLEAMLQRVAIQQEGDVEALINTTLSLFEPVMILLMGSIVLFIVLAVMLPIFALDQMSGLS